MTLLKQIIHIIDPILLQEREDEETVMNETRNEGQKKEVPKFKNA